LQLNPPKPKQPHQPPRKNVLKSRSSVARSSQRDKQHNQFKSYD
jgi:hypothetical protein